MLPNRLCLPGPNVFGLRLARQMDSLSTALCFALDVVRVLRVWLVDSAGNVPFSTPRAVTPILSAAVYYNFCWRLHLQFLHPGPSGSCDWKSGQSPFAGKWDKEILPVR
jgi:hypothetical protein